VYVFDIRLPLSHTSQPFYYIIITLIFARSFEKHALSANSLSESEYHVRERGNVGTENRKNHSNQDWYICHFFVTGYYEPNETYRRDQVARIT